MAATRRACPVKIRPAGQLSGREILCASGPLDSTFA
jgi:hypothetical protein